MPSPQVSLGQAAVALCCDFGKDPTPWTTKESKRVSGTDIVEKDLRVLMGTKLIVSQVTDH